MVVSSDNSLFLFRELNLLQVWFPFHSYSRCAQCVVAEWCSLDLYAPHPVDSLPIHQLRRVFSPGGPGVEGVPVVGSCPMYDDDTGATSGLGHWVVGKRGHGCTCGGAVECYERGVVTSSENVVVSVARVPWSSSSPPPSEGKQRVGTVERQARLLESPNISQALGVRSVWRWNGRGESSGLYAQSKTLHWQNVKDGHCTRYRLDQTIWCFWKREDLGMRQQGVTKRGNLNGRVHPTTWCKMVNARPPSQLFVSIVPVNTFS